MDLDLDETQGLLRASVRDFLERELPFERVRRLERENRWDAPLWSALCAQGWPALPFAASARMRSRRPGRSDSGATSSRRYRVGRLYPVRWLNSSVRSVPTSGSHVSRPRSS